MTVRINPRRFTGTVKVPPSKSHTIRQLMTGELAKLGICCTELPDGLIIHGKGGLFPCGIPSGIPVIDGHGDHRIVTAFAAASLGSPVPIDITDAECADVTYPGFLDLFVSKK